MSATGEGEGEREKTVCNEEALNNVHRSFIANPKEAAQLQSDRERLEMVRGVERMMMMMMMMMMKMMFIMLMTMMMIMMMMETRKRSSF